MFHHEVSEGKVIENRATALEGAYYKAPPRPEVRPDPVASTGKFLSSDSSDEEEIVFDTNELLQIHDWFKNKMNAPQYSQQDRPLSYFSDDSSSDDQYEEPTPWETIERCFKNIDDQMDYVYTCIAQDDWEEQGLFTLPDDVAERLNGYSQDF